MDEDLIVVGGGLAGLAAAALAGEAGLRVRLLEGGGEVGGRARSTQHEGWVMNMGPHALYELGGGAAVLDRLGVDRSGGRPSVDPVHLLIDGRWARMPVTARQLLTTSLLGPAERLWLAQALGRTLVSAVRSPAGLDEVAIGEWMDRRLGSGPARHVFEAIWRLSTYTADPGMSAAAALRQIGIGTRGGVTYVDGGWQRLVDGLRRAASQRGVVIDTGRAVRVIERTDGGVAVRTDDGTTTATSVIIAAGGPARVDRIAAGVVDDVVRARMAAARPVRAAVLDVALRELPDDGVAYVLGGDVPIYGAIHSTVARLAPQGGATVHLATYLGDEPSDPHRHRSTLEDVMDRWQPGWRGHVVRARFLPDMVVSHDLVAAATGGLPGRTPVVAGEGVLLAGDWVGQRGLLANAALCSAEEAAAAAVERSALLARRGGRARPVVRRPEEVGR